MHEWWGKQIGLGAPGGPEESREIQEGFIAEAIFEFDLERQGNA